jgi:hypothetical protein
MNSLIRLAANALPGEKKYVLFAGAGVSKDAGIPTAWDLMLETAKYVYLDVHPDQDKREVTSKEIEDWFVDSKYAKMEYAEVVGGIYTTPPEQQGFFEDVLGKHEAGNAHRTIAEMVRRGILRAIITTNFDHCLENALKETGQEVQVIASDDALESTEPLIHCKKVRVYKPHGTLGEGALRNTPKDLESLSPLIEKELIRLLSEHGVIIIGYSGRDPGILKVLRSRKNTYYPMFWVNPELPSDNAQKLIDNERVVYTQCKGAGAFLNDLLKLQDRIRALAPSGSFPGPTIADLKEALSGSESASMRYRDFLEGITQDLKKIKPDFSRFDNLDEAIYNQIEIGEDISYRFIEAVLLAARYDDAEVFKTIYNFFGEYLKLYEPPRGFSGTYKLTDFDGYKYLIYEMFLGFVASLIHSSKWVILRGLLKHELFVEEHGGEHYKNYTYINEHLASLEDYRQKRLNLNRISLSADMLKERFSDGKLSNLLSFRDIIDGDFFLFQYAVYNFYSAEKYSRNSWNPKTSIYLHHEEPRYLKMAESKEYYSKIYDALRLASPQAFVDGLPLCRDEYDRYYRGSYRVDNPLDYVDSERLGSKV